MIRNLLVCILLSMLLAGPAVSQPQRCIKDIKDEAGHTKYTLKGPAAGSIAFTGPAGSIHSMDSADSKYGYIQIVKGKITQLEKNEVADADAIKLPEGAVIYPGFIDSHSHMIGFAAPLIKNSQGQHYFINLASVNVQLQPPCRSGQRRPDCFKPIEDQEQVNDALKEAIPISIPITKKDPKTKADKIKVEEWVLGYNYEPSRLACTDNGSKAYGFACTSFANPPASEKPPATIGPLNMLDTLAKQRAEDNDVKILVTSESGHIVYVNSAALKALNICGTGLQFEVPETCYNSYLNVGKTPLEIKAARDKKIEQAKKGQLNEDLAAYAQEYIIGAMMKLHGAQMIETASRAYSQLGFTTAQEGAASLELINAYWNASAKGILPLRLAALNYIEVLPDDNTLPENLKFSNQVRSARILQDDLIINCPDVFIAGIKEIADGSNQGYTGKFTPPPTAPSASPTPMHYMNPPPFTNSPPFSETKDKTYGGVQDLTQSQITGALFAAHKWNFPLWVHANGNVAQTDTLWVLEHNRKEGLRNVVIHFTTPTKQQVEEMEVSNSEVRRADWVGVTFLANNFYYYYQPLCQQILGPQADNANMYPAKWAADSNVHFGLHSDTTVTPPSPLFSMSVATTREPQHPAWIPTMEKNDPCQQALEQQQTISRPQAMKAYTSDAAWLYGRETTRGTTTLTKDSNVTVTLPGIGSLQDGFAGDLVVLSADPLAKDKDHKDIDLSTIKVLYTVYNGNIVYEYSPPVIWPN